MQAIKLRKGQINSVCIIWLKV